MSATQAKQAAQKTAEELQQELDEANARAATLEDENRAAAAQIRRANKHAAVDAAAAAEIAGGRVRGFFSRMGKVTVAAAAASAGALLGVGGTVLVQKRMNRTAVGTTDRSEETPMISE